jgi:hypothetical protein
MSYSFLTLVDPKIGNRMNLNMPNCVRKPKGNIQLREEVGSYKISAVLLLKMKKQSNMHLLQVDLRVSDAK